MEPHTRNHSLTRCHVCVSRNHQLVKPLLVKAVKDLENLDKKKAFLKPVDAGEHPGYYGLIKNPVFTSTLKKECKKPGYTFAHFQTDVRCITSNAIEFFTSPGKTPLPRLTRQQHCVLTTNHDALLLAVPAATQMMFLGKKPSACVRSLRLC